MFVVILRITTANWKDLYIASAYVVALTLMNECMNECESACVWVYMTCVVFSIYTEHS